VATARLGLLELRSDQADEGGADSSERVSLEERAATHSLPFTPHLLSHLQVLQARCGRNLVLDTPLLVGSQARERSAVALSMAELARGAER